MDDSPPGLQLYLLGQIALHRGGLAVFSEDTMQNARKVLAMAFRRNCQSVAVAFKAKGMSQDEAYRKARKIVKSTWKKDRPK